MLVYVPRMWILLQREKKGSETRIRELRIWEADRGARLGREDVRVCEDDTRATSVLNHESSLALMTRDTTNGSREMVPQKRLDILDLE